MILRTTPYLVLALMLLPIGGGLLATLVPSFGYFPALGGMAFSFEPWRELLAWPGLSQSLWLTVFTGFVSTLIAFLLVQVLLGLSFGTRWLTRFSALISPIISVPHAAMAVGLVFLIAPSGFGMRVISPELSGFNRPPDWLIVGDEWGLSLVAGLIIKEFPYLLLMSLAAVNQIPAAASLKMGQALGHTRLSSWFRLILPQLYPHLRLALFAVLAFSLSTVEMALILGPTTPRPLAPQILSWFSDPELDFRFLGSAGATLLTLIMIASVGLWIAGERLVWRASQNWLTWGAHGPRPFWPWLERFLVLPMLAVSAMGLMSLVLLAIWSVARRWRFPDILPSKWSFFRWTSHAEPIIETFSTTLILGLIATAIGMALTLLSLENEARHGKRLGRYTDGLKYLPLLVPQTSFLFGVQILAIWSGLTVLDWVGDWSLVIWGHLLFVLPYCFIGFSLSFSQLDPRMLASARSLGAGPWRIFWQIKLPLLAFSLAVTVAIALSVSVAQYLPTLVLSGGRITTLTTETVSLASGSDRRLLAVYALSQAVLPFACLLAAIAIPRLAFINRRGMQP